MNEHEMTVIIIQGQIKGTMKSNGQKGRCEGLADRVEVDS